LRPGQGKKTFFFHVPRGLSLLRLLRLNLWKEPVMEQITWSMPSNAKTIEVVYVSGDRGPTGACRPVHQCWSKDGRLLAEFDDVGHQADAMGYVILDLRGQVARLRAELACVAAWADEDLGHE
jgi:hypothetical protein